VGWRGYKAHFTETCEPDRPHLIVHVATTVATTTDIDTMPARHADLASTGLLPDEHLVDASYVSVDGVLDARADHGVELVGPLPPDSGWQARDEAGFDLTRFEIDWDHKQVTCPNGKTACPQLAPGHQPPRVTHRAGHLPHLRLHPLPRPRPLHPRPPTPATSPSGPARSTKPNASSAPSRPPRPGRTAMRTAPGSKAPSRRWASVAWCWAVQGSASSAMSSPRCCRAMPVKQGWDRAARTHVGVRIPA